jgi:hypothetical protein
MTNTQELMLLDDVARAHHCAPTSLRKLLRRHGRRVFRIGRRAALTLAEVEWITRHRESLYPVLAKRPAGWLGSKQVMAILGVSPNTLVYLRQSGELQAVRVSNLLYHDPEGVEVSRLRRAPPVVGWVPLRGTVPGVPDSTLRGAVARLNIETRKFHQAKTTPGRACEDCIRDTDIPRLEAALLMPEPPAGAVTVRQLAELTGATLSRAGHWLQDGMPHTRGRYGRHRVRYVLPEDALQWLEGQGVRQAACADQLRRVVSQQVAA